VEKRTEEKWKACEENRIPTEALAAIIIDALLDVGIVKKTDVQRALEIAMDKIDGRKELGDY
jgi:hypothetical protein